MKWKYAVIYRSDPKEVDNNRWSTALKITEAALNEMGSYGWELVSVDVNVYYFKKWSWF